MKLPHRTASRRTLVIASLWAATSAWTQEAITTATTTVVAPILRETGPQSLSRPPAPTGAFFQFGNISVHPLLSAQWAVSSGVPTGGGKSIDTTTSTYSAALNVDAGQHWAFSYTPTWTVYNSAELSDSVSHALSLSGAGMVQDWNLQVAESYSTSSSILFETGRQTKQTNSATSVHAGTTFGSKFAFQTSASINDRAGSDGVAGDQTVSITTALLVAFSKKLQGGISLGQSYSSLPGQNDTTSGTYMGQLSWIPTNKLRVSLNGGIETTHPRGSDPGGDLSNPVVSGSLSYQPFDVTTISLSNSRTVTNSLFAGQVSVGSNWSLTWSQRLLGHLFLSTSYTRGDTEHKSIDDAVASSPVPGTQVISLPGRSDRTNSFNIGLSTQLFKRLSINTGYQHNSNSSSQSAFTATTTQYSLGLGVAY